MAATIWFIIFGGVFIVMGLAASLVRRLPLTTSLLYLAIGVALGPLGLGFFRLDPIRQAALLERGTEIVVIISLFAAGLKLRVPWNNARWKIAFRLAFVSMLITVGLISVVAYYLLSLPLGAAIILGAVLAPTDPVLASDVQVRDAEDQDRLRFSLTSEAGLNDGTAFPLVMLGLGLLGLHELGENGTRWILVDVLWAIPGGLAVGAVLGTVISKLVIKLRHRHRENVILDDFLALGLIAISYGLALLLKTYGFLAVFAAGLALRRTERMFSGDKPAPQVKDLARLGKHEEIATASPETVPAYTAQAVLLFNEQLERLGEVAMVILLGGMAWSASAGIRDLWFVPLLFLVIRPLSASLGLWGTSGSRAQHALISWFGIRGIGSLYYLFYAITHGLPADLAQRLSAITLAVVACSIVVHGISVTPLMNAYARRHAPRHRPISY